MAMESLDELNSALDTIEKTISNELSRAVEGTQLEMNSAWRKDERPELRRAAAERIRRESIGKHGPTSRQLAEIADSVRSTVEERWSDEAISARAVITPGESLATNLTAEAGLQARLGRASDTEVLEWLRMGSENGSRRLFDLALAEAKGRKRISTEAIAFKARLPEHPDVARGREVAERAQRLANEAQWARQKLEAMQVGDDATPPVSDHERVTRKAQAIKETLAAAGERIAGAFGA